jgi:hypothetical protein
MMRVIGMFAVLLLLVGCCAVAKVPATAPADGMAFQIRVLAVDNNFLDDFGLDWSDTISGFPGGGPTIQSASQPGDQLNVLDSFQTSLIIRASQVSNRTLTVRPVVVTVPLGGTRHFDLDLVLEPAQRSPASGPAASAVAPATRPFTLPAYLAFTLSASRAADGKAIVLLVSSPNPEFRTHTATANIPPGMTMLFPTPEPPAAGRPANNGAISALPGATRPGDERTLMILIRPDNPATQPASPSGAQGERR